MNVYISLMIIGEGQAVYDSLSFRNGSAYKSLSHILYPFFPEKFLVSFDQFRKIPFDELPKRAVIESEPPGQRLHAFGCSSVQPYGFAVFLHTATGYHTASIRSDHSLPGIQFRLVFFQVGTEAFRL